MTEPAESCGDFTASLKQSHFTFIMAKHIYTEDNSYYTHYYSTIYTKRQCNVVLVSALYGARVTAICWVAFDYKILLYQ